MTVSLETSKFVWSKVMLMNGGPECSSNHVHIENITAPNCRANDLGLMITRKI